MVSFRSLSIKDAATQLARHREFHAAIYRASHNALLVESLDAHWDKTDRYRRHALQVERSEDELEQRAEEHRLLLEAIQDRDGAAASDLMHRHVETSLGAKSAWRLAAATRSRLARPGKDLEDVADGMLRSMEHKDASRFWSSALNGSQGQGA